MAFDRLLNNGRAAVWVFCIALLAAVACGKLDAPLAGVTGLAVVASVGFAATVGCQVTMWRWERRERAGLCGRCGYDRRGLAADAKCPECGTVGEGRCGDG